MNRYWKTSKHRANGLAALASLAAVAGALGCASLFDNQFWSGLRGVTHPVATVNLEPARFCVGQMLTATWNGGAQIRNCDAESPNSEECKASTLRAYPFSEGLFFGGYQSPYLTGSVSGATDYDLEYTATFRVVWDGWSNFRAYRQARTDGSGWTGVVQAQDSASPMVAGDYEVSYAYSLVCDEATGTWQLDKNIFQWREPLPGGGYSGYPGPYEGALSACAGITEVCVPASVGRVQISAAGGPTVVIGGEGNPLCTDAFWGYHPDDLQSLPLDYPLPRAIGSPCAGAAPFNVGSFGNFSMAGSTLCAQRFVGETLVGVSNAPGAYEYGTVQLQGAALDRCRAALDPVFLAAYDAHFGAIPPGGGGSPGEPPATPAPTASPTEPVSQPTEPATAPPDQCAPGWLPASGCVCCGTSLTCSDGTVAQFNPTCMGGGEPESCTTNADCPPGQYCSLVTGKCEPFG